MQGTPMQFASLDKLLWGLMATLQYYSLPVMALSIAAIGMGLIVSGDDTEQKHKLKRWITNILIGGLLLFGATTIAGVVKGFLGGS